MNSPKKTKPAPVARPELGFAAFWNELLEGHAQTLGEIKLRYSKWTKVKMPARSISAPARGEEGRTSVGIVPCHASASRWVPRARAVKEECRKVVRRSVGASVIERSVPRRPKRVAFGEGLAGCLLVPAEGRDGCGEDNPCPRVSFAPAKRVCSQIELTGPASLAFSYQRLRDDKKVGRFGRCPRFVCCGP